MPSSRRSFLAAVLAASAGCTDLRSESPADGGTPAFGDETPVETPPADGPDYALWSNSIPNERLGIVALGGAPETPVLFAASAAREDGSTDDHTLLALSLQDGTRRWRLDTADPVRSVPQYVGADGPEYVFETGRPSRHGKGSAVHAVTPANREHVWRFDTEGRRILEVIGVDDGRVFVGTRDDEYARDGEAVYGVDATDGERLWETETGDVGRTGHAVRRDALLVDSARQLEVLEAASGDVRWRVDAGSQAYDNRAERVFVEQDDTVRGLSLSDGSEIWSREFDGTATRVVSPRQALSDRVFVGGYDGRLHALSPLDGTTAWTRSFDREQFRPGVERTSSRLFVDGAGVHALDPVGGERQWAFTPDVEGRVAVETGAPSTVFATSRRNVWALDAETGDPRWQFSPGERLAGVAVAGEVAWVGVGDTVHALDGSESS